MATPAQIAEVQTAYFAINRVELNATVANATADAIANGTTNLDTYISQLLASAVSTTQAAVAISAFVTGVTPTAAKLGELKVAADLQVASYTAMGVSNPQLGAYEAFGKDFSQTPEFATKYGTVAGPDFINAVYVSVYGVAPSAGAFANLTSQLAYFTTIYTAAGIADAANQAKGAVLGQIVGYAFVTDASATATLDNQVASFLTAAANGSTSGFGQALPASTGIPGSTFSLTSGVDVLNGTAGNDILIAGTQAGNATLTAGDAINGGAGTDQLNVFGGANAAAVAGTSLTSVERVQVQFDNTTNTGVNVSGQAGVEQVIVSNGTIVGGQTVTLTKAQVAGVTGSVAGASVLTLAYSNATAGTSDAASLLLSGSLAAGATLDVDAIETLNVNATANSNVRTLSADSVSTLNISGAGSFAAVADTAGGTYATVNASANTGGVNLDLGAIAAANHTITGGSGNDTIELTFANQTAADVINLGDGVDTLLFDDAVTISVAADAALVSGVSGVEELGTVNALLTVDGDLVSQTRFSTNGAAGDMAITDAAQGTTLEFGVGAILASTAALKLGANTLNVELQGGAGGAADLSLGLAVTGSATVNVVSTGTVGQPNNVLALTAADNQSVVLTGAQNTTLSVTAATGTTGVSINASAFTGNGTITGSQAADIVIGGSGNDIISGGAGAAVADTLTGNGGADKFIIIAGVTAATADTVTDFLTKSDTISFGGDAGAAGNYTEGAAAVADFAAALAAANAVLTGAVGLDQYNAQQVGSDVFVFHNDGGAAGADQIVKLTGVSLAGIEFGDVVA